MITSVRLKEEYASEIESMKITLSAMGYEMSDQEMVRLVLLTGIKAINLKIGYGINVFEKLYDNEGNEETDD